jgi:hypothetical protein
MVTVVYDLQKGDRDDEVEAVAGCQCDSSGCWMATSGELLRDMEWEFGTMKEAEEVAAKLEKLPDVKVSVYDPSEHPEDEDE